MKIALICIAKDEHYIQEWIDYNLKLGIDHIFIYMNDWRTPIEHEQLTKIPFDGKVRQLASYNSFIKHYSNEFDYGIFIDCDEYIVLKEQNNIKDFIRLYSNPNGIGINWKMFGSGGRLTRENDSLIKQFTKSQNGVNRHIKSIINLKNKHHKFVNPHHTNLSVFSPENIRITGPFHPKGSDKIAYIAHYYYKTYQDWELRIKRGMADNLGNRNINEWLRDIHIDVDIDNFDVYNFMYPNE